MFIGYFVLSGSGLLAARNKLYYNGDEPNMKLYNRGHKMLMLALAPMYIDRLRARVCSVH